MSGRQRQGAATMMMDGVVSSDLSAVARTIEHATGLAQTHAQSQVQQPQGTEVMAQQRQQPGGDDDPAASVAAPAQTKKKSTAFNEEKLLNPTNGIPYMYRKFEQHIKFSSAPGSESHNLRMLMNQYDVWMDQLVPGLSIPDVVRSIEKLGHKTRVKEYVQNLRLGLAVQEEIAQSEPRAHTATVASVAPSTSLSAPSHQEQGSVDSHVDKEQEEARQKNLERANKRKALLEASTQQNTTTTTTNEISHAQPGTTGEEREQQQHQDEGDRVEMHHETEGRPRASETGPIEDRREESVEAAEEDGETAADADAVADAQDTGEQPTKKPKQTAA